MSWEDLWARYGWSKVSLFIGLIAALIQATLGIVGGIAGLFGGRLDIFIMRLLIF